jgi:hypothetical protein
MSLMPPRNRDLQLTASGDWEPFDVFPGEDDPETEKALEEQGWESFLTLGSGERLGCEIEVYLRNTEGGQQYLVEVWGEQYGSPYLKVDSLPALMDLLGRWAPVVQAASVARVLSEIKGLTIERDGLVEAIAARIAWAVTEHTPKLKRERDELDRMAAERRAQRKASKA